MAENFAKMMADGVGLVGNMIVIDKKSQPDK